MNPDTIFDLFDPSVLSDEDVDFLRCSLECWLQTHFDDEE